MLYRKNYFNNQTTKRSEIYKRYINIIEDVGVKMMNRSICDLGCATGEFIENVINNNLCYGIDISAYVISKCQKRFPNIKENFLCLDLNKESLNSKLKFDIITLFDVIEHLDNFINFEKIIKNNLKQNGYIVITTPNANSFIRPIAKKSFTGELDTTHKILFTPYTLDFFLKRKGLRKIALFTPYNFYFHNNFLSKRLLFGGQIFAIYKKI